jgi:hypothetical protein
VRYPHGRERGFLSAELKHFLLSGFPAVLNERLLGEGGIVHGQMEYVLSFFELHEERLYVHTLLPKSGGYLARQSGALGEPEPKLFHLRHDLNDTYGRGQFQGDARQCG